MAKPQEVPRFARDDNEKQNLKTKAKTKAKIKAKQIVKNSRR